MEFGYPLIPSLLVRDMAETIAFYRDLLGFQVVGSPSDDVSPDWCELRNGVNTIQFFTDPPKGIEPPPALTGTLYFPCADVDGLAERMRDHVSLEWGPETMDYGMREFGVRDPNGYLLAFTQPA